MPSPVASTMVSAATRTLSQVAASQAGLVKYFSYHWSDQPGGGKVRNFAELNEMGTITNMGRRRKRRIKPVSV